MKIIHSQKYSLNKYEIIHSKKLFIHFKNGLSPRASSGPTACAVNDSFGQESIVCAMADNFGLDILGFWFWFEDLQCCTKKRDGCGGEGFQRLF